MAKGRQCSQSQQHNADLGTDRQSDDLTEIEVHRHYHAPLIDGMREDFFVW
jgi:hypothetical protein